MSLSFGSGRVAGMAGTLACAHLFVFATGADAQTVPLDTITVERRLQDETAAGPVNGYVAQRSATGTKTNSSLMENPQSVTVITREQMEAQGVRNVAEALRYEPGVISETRVGDRYDSVFVRGFGGYGGNANYLHFWDGLRLPRGANYANPSVDPYLLERVEILRGPASILYGQNNPGGLVNLVSKRPTETQTNEIMVRVGSHNRLEGGFDVSGPVDKDRKLLYRFIGLGRKADTEVDYNKSERLLIAPSFTWRPDLGTSLTLHANYSRDPSSFYPNWLPALGTLQANPNGQIPRNLFSGHPDFNTFDRKQFNAGYEFEHRVSDVWTVRQNLRYTNLDSTFKAASVSAGGPAPLGYVGAAACGGVANLCLFRTSTYFIEKLEAVSLDNQAEAKFATGALKHTMLAGLDYQWSSAGANSNNLGGPGGAVPNLNYLNPSYGTIVPPALTFSTDQTRKQLGVYAQDQIKLDNWTFLLGIRHDQSNQSTQSRNINTGAVSAVAKPSDSAVTWRAGAIYQFENGLAPYVSYSTSFEPTLGTDYLGTAFVPTTGKQIEGGIKYQPTWFKGHFILSVFDIRQQNVLTMDNAHPSGANPLCTASANFCQIQLGEVRSRGFEVSGKANPLPGLNLIASYSHTDVRTTRSEQVVGGIPLQGKVPVGAPTHTASAWADYTFQHGSLTGFGIGAGVRYVGSSYGDNINSAAMIVPAYTLVDLGLSYDLGVWGPQLKDWKLSLNVHNLFDKDYVSGCASATQCFYGLGRTVLAQARFRW